MIEEGGFHAVDSGQDIKYNIKYIIKTIIVRKRKETWQNQYRD